MIDTKRVKSNVIFGDLNFEDYNAFAFGCNLFDRPERSVEVIQIPGRNGDLVLDNGKYNNIDRVYHVQVTGIRNIDSLISKLSSMVGYYRLEDEYEPDVYFTARLKSPPEILRIVGENAHLLITLDRYPQKLRKSTEDNMIHPEYVNYCVPKTSNGNKLLFYKYAIYNTKKSSYYTILYEPQKYSYSHGMGVTKLNENITSDYGGWTISEQYANVLVKSNYYAYSESYGTEHPDIAENVLFYCIPEEGTEGVTFETGDWISLDTETNVLTINDRLKTTGLRIAQLNAAYALDLGMNYIYVSVYDGGVWDDSEIEQTRSSISFAIKEYDI